LNENTQTAEQAARKPPAIGCSLPYKMFKGDEEDEACRALVESGGGTLERLLENIRRAGAACVEFRSVSPGADPLVLLTAYRLCRSAGLELSIHATTPKDLQRAEKFFSPYEALFGAQGQRRFILTLHALGGKETTCAVLNRVAQTARENGYPVQLVLENSRHKEPGDAGDSCEAVLGILAHTADPEWGICWDFGHYYYNIINCFEGLPGSVPPHEFLRRVRHTHIHAVLDGRTHFPLGAGDLPLARYCNALKGAGYGGIYNLELGFARFYTEMNPYEELIRSACLLKEALQDAS